jgi:hypothetical protein
MTTRTELIADCAIYAKVGVSKEARALVRRCKDMLEADGKPGEFVRLRAQLEQEWCDVRALKASYLANLDSDRKLRAAARLALNALKRTDQLAYEDWMRAYGEKAIAALEGALK